MASPRSASAMEDLNFIGNDPGAVRYGNFINYYDFHPAKARINILPKDIWDSPNNSEEVCTVLDVGCNCGDLTTALHKFLSENTKWSRVVVLGIDIDPSLIARAKEKENDNVSFECMDIMSETSKKILDDYLGKFSKTRFDVVFSFSITMWIHLNNGDDGLLSFLTMLCEQANMLVIEPQPWKCYRTAERRMKKSGGTFLKYSTLKIRSNVQDEIKSCISRNNFTCLLEVSSTEWNRSVLFCKRQ